MPKANEPPIEGMKTRPYGVADAPSLFVGPWVSCLMWAASSEECLDAFYGETGHDIRLLLSANGIEKLIDEATGRSKVVIAAFADWVTRNIWGEDDGTEGTEHAESN